MGKVNAYAAVQEALNLIGIPENTQDKSWNVFPNPVMETLHFTLVDELPKVCTIIDAQGQRTVLSILQEQVNVKQLKPGKYTLQMEVGGHLQSVSFIKSN
jgi:hypothetical protein